MKSEPRYLLMVLAFAGDSTITSDLPLDPFVGDLVGDLVGDFFFFAAMKSRAYLVRVANIGRFAAHARQ